MSHGRIAFAVTLIFGLLFAQTAYPETPGTLPFPALKNVDAWNLLPREKPPLPVWARTLVESLPKTTAAMLHLDYVQRENNPLGPILSGKIRWVAANANKCNYAKRYAEADLKRAGLGDADFKALAGSWEELPEIDRQTLAFAQKMTLAASTVTDDEVAQLLKHYGPEKLVAMVHTLAYANFHQRIILALGVEVEADGPYVPIDFRLDAEEKAKIVVPPRVAVKGIPGETVPATKDRPKWVGQDSGLLNTALERQKERKTRIPLPPIERLASFPADVQKRSFRIVWSRVSLGYSPLLTQAWFDCMGTFTKEAEIDEVFANTYFWVVTRSNECFY